MKTSKAVLALAIVLAGAFAAESALARGRHHSRVGVGISIGVPLVGWGYYYPPPYYYYPPYYYPQTVVVPSQPQVYIEQGGQPAAPAQGYWYYCADSRSYYPYVKDCPGGWQRVSPQPQN